MPASPHEKPQSEASPAGVGGLGRVPCVCSPRPFDRTYPCRCGSAVRITEQGSALGSLQSLLCRLTWDEAPLPTSAPCAPCLVPWTNPVSGDNTIDELCRNAVQCSER